MWHNAYHMAKSERLTITLGPDQRRQLTKIAQRRRTSTATVIRWAVDDYIRRTSRRKPKTKAVLV
jgi:predicted transcriptional regulator